MLYCWGIEQGIARALTLHQLVQVFDSWAGELSPSTFREFSEPYLAYIANRLPEKLIAMGFKPVPMIVFPKGAWYALESVSKMGYNVVSLDWLHDPAEAVKTRGDLPIVLQGNADPGVLYGSKASITETVQEMVDGFGWRKSRKGWIVNLGHGKFYALSLAAVATTSNYVLFRNNSVCQAGRFKILLRRGPSLDQNG